MYNYECKLLYLSVFFFITSTYVDTSANNHPLIITFLLCQPFIETNLVTENRWWLAVLIQMKACHHLAHAHYDVGDDENWYDDGDDSLCDEFSWSVYGANVQLGKNSFDLVLT